MSQYDDVKKPFHYNQAQVEHRDFAKSVPLHHLLACPIKYLQRAPHKGSERLDLEKTREYLRDYRDWLRAGSPTEEHDIVTWVDRLGIKGGWQRAAAIKILMFNQSPRITHLNSAIDAMDELLATYAQTGILGRTETTHGGTDDAGADAEAERTNQTGA